MSGDAARRRFQPQRALVSAQWPIRRWLGHHQRAGLTPQPAARQCERTLASSLLPGGDVKHDAGRAYETRRMLQGGDDKGGNAALHV